VQHLPTQRQTLLFSATMPDAIRHLAHSVLRDPVTVQVDHTVPLLTIAHALYQVAPNRKTALLTALLRHTRPTSGLVFTRTKHSAKRVAQHLATAGYRATSLQGNLSQSRRQAALDGFRDGAFEILVATDIAARGLDVWHISHVINYDMPDTVEAYMHRIGRTGRATRTGVAFTLATHEDTEMVHIIERALGAPLERRTLQDFDNAMPGSTSDADYDRSPRPQRWRSQSAPAHARAQVGSSMQAEMPLSAPALHLSSSVGSSSGRSNSRRWQPGGTVRRRW